MWTEQAERHGKREQRIAPRAFVAQRREQCQEGKRQHRGDEELAVVTRVHVRDHDSRQLVRESPGDAADPRRSQSPQEQVHQKAGEDVMDDEREIHRLVHGHHQTQRGRGIEHVAVCHDVDVRQPEHDHRVPQGELTRLSVGVFCPDLHRVATVVLIAVRGREPTAREHRQREDDDEERHDTQGGEMRMTRRVGNRWSCGRGGHGISWMSRRRVPNGPSPVE